MDYSNYTVFAILKFKVEFLDCLEYSLLNYKVENESIKNNLTHLEEEFSNGIYKQIVSKLFTSFNKLNEPLFFFFKKYKYSKIVKIIESQNIKEIIKYNERLIDCFETFNYILSAFFEEKEIYSKLNEDIIKLSDISNRHFVNFLFFNIYYRYINLKDNLSKNIIKKLFRIMNYCNKDNEFNDYFDDNKTTNDKIEKLSNQCILIEKEQYNALEKAINLINDKIKNH